MRIDVLARISQLLVIRFQSPAMFDAAQSNFALASNIQRLSPDFPNEHHSLPEKLFGGFSI
jgi:hypothetical protein